MKRTERSTNNIVYDFNKSEGVDTTPYGGTAPEFTGTIRFSGAEADRLITQAAGESEQDWQNRLAESKYFNVSGKTTLYDGTLILEDGVTYGSSDLTRIPPSPSTKAFWKLRQQFREQQGHRLQRGSNPEGRPRRDFPRRHDRLAKASPSTCAPSWTITVPD